MKDLNAEACVLSAMMQGNDAIAKIADMIRVEHFYSGDHRKIFNVIMDCYNSNEPVDIITLNSKIKSTEIKKLILEIDDVVLSDSLIVSHANLLIEKYQQRQVHRLLKKYSYQIESGEVNINDAISGMQSDLYSIMNEADKKELIQVGETIPETIRYIEQRMEFKKENGIYTGLENLDELLTLSAGKLIVVGARPGAGKSILCNQIGVYNAVYYDHVVSHFSCEMTKNETNMRSFAYLCNIPFDHLERAHFKLEDSDLHKISEKSELLFNKDLYLCDDFALTTENLRSRCMNLKYKTGKIDLIIVDYIQRMKPNPKLSRRDQISEISRELKTLAGELNTVVIAISSIKRGNEIEPPGLSDFKESGDIEHDADICLGLWNDYKFENNALDGETTCRILKNRQGKTNEVKIKLCNDMHFEDWK